MAKGGARPSTRRPGRISACCVAMSIVWSLVAASDGRRRGSAPLSLPDSLPGFLWDWERRQRECPAQSKQGNEGRGCGAGRPHGGRTRIDAGWTDRRRNLTALERATLTIHESTQSNEEHFLVNFLPSFTCQFIVKIVFEFSTIFLFHMITFFYLKILSIMVKLAHPVTIKKFS